MRLHPLLLCTILAGCATPEQIAYQRQIEAQEQERRNQAYTQNLAAQCRAVGYQDGTDALRNCIVTLHGQNQQNASQQQAIMLQEALRRQGQSLPYCSTLPAGTAGMARAQGRCQ